MSDQSTPEPDTLREWRRLATEGYLPRGNRAAWALRCVVVVDALAATEPDTRTEQGDCQRCGHRRGLHSENGRWCSGDSPLGDWPCECTGYAQPAAASTEQPADATVDWNHLYHGTCPKCGERKFIGHGPLCVDCYAGVAEQPAAADVEALCEIMHDAYEKAAVGAGWETQQASRKPWADVPEANKATMRAAVSALLDSPQLAADRAQQRAEALREFAALRDEMAEAWGRDRNWLTTGTRVAMLVADWANGEADRIEQGGAS